jgi:hypothetical protein
MYSVIVLIGATLVQGAATSELLARVAERDPIAISELRSEIFDRACEKPVQEALLQISTKKGLSYAEIDLLVHGAIFCNVYGARIVQNIVDSQELTSVRRSDIQTLIAVGMKGLARDPRKLDRLVDQWSPVIDEVRTSAAKLSDDRVLEMLDTYRMDADLQSSDRLCELISPLATLGRTNLAEKLIRELAKIDPTDRFIATELAKRMDLMATRLKRSRLHVEFGWKSVISPHCWCIRVLV